MSATQRFRRGYRYTLEGEEHAGECACKRCLSYDEFCEKRLYGEGHVARRGVVYGAPVTITRR